MNQPPDQQSHTPSTRPKKPAPKRVLFVCLGNICRSPAAEGVFRQLAADEGVDVYIDSAGTGAWHVGNPPDTRMIAAARRRGYDLSRQRARKVEFSDFYEFDYLLAMDLSNHANLLSMATPDRDCDIRLFLDFAQGEEREVPDPYYGGDDGFDHVLDLIEAASRGFLEHLRNDDE